MRVEGFTFFENNQMEEVIITSLSPSSASDGRIVGAIRSL